MAEFTLSLTLSKSFILLKFTVDPESIPGMFLAHRSRVLGSILVSWRHVLTMSL